ncbi:MAG: glycosyltransferase family 9 protein [Cytophagales bacterium]|nr:glycosyltransferase family 9 protein [Armatimonadota bacterium]
MPLSPPESRTVRTVLVITKHNFMGDTIVATPLLRGVRHAFPQAAITLLTGGAAAQTLLEFPFVDNIEAYDPKRTQKGAAASWRLICALRGRIGGSPDLCLVADRSVRAALIALLCRARVRAGFDTEGRGCLLTHRVPYDLEKRESECCLDILRAVTAPGPLSDTLAGSLADPMPLLCITETERRRGAAILREREALGPVLVGIQPGASYRAKQWDPSRFAEVARALAGEGASIVLLGSGTTERDASRVLREAMGERFPVVDLTGETSMRETMGILAHLSLFIGNDTGVSHIAAALGTPTVSLFGPTLAEKWGEASPRNLVIAAPDGCLKKLEVAPVLSAARTLLLSSSPPNPVSPSDPTAAADSAIPSTFALGANR